MSVQVQAFPRHGGRALGLLSSENAALGKRFDPAVLARRHGFTDTTGIARFLTDLLVQDAFDHKVASAVATSKEPASLVLTSPEYQLA